MAQLYDELADRVAERTDGRFQINVTLVGELGVDSGEFLPALNANRIQMAELFIGHQSGQIPVLGVFGLPFLIGGLDDADTVGDAVRDIVQPEFGRFGVMTITEYLVPGVNLWASRPVEDITDWNGLSVRTFDETSTRVVEALNGTGVVMGGGEVYEAIQRGVVEGGLTSTGAALSLNWDEVAQNGYVLNITFPYVYIGVSDQAFQALPQEYQTILLEEAERIDGRFKEEFVVVDEESNQEWLDEGGTLTEVPADELEGVKEQVAFIWDEWADGTGPLARDAMDEALDALGLR